MISLVVVLFVLNSYSQKFDLGKVSLAELQEKEHPKDPSAAAAILFEKGTVRINYDQTDGFTMNTEVKVRVKIYKKEGYDWATKSLTYYLPSAQRETVRFDDAVTYNLVNGEIIKTKLKSDGEFDEQVNRYWGQRKITMPAVKEGSVIEYSYNIKSQRFDQIREWNFQREIPVNYSEYRTFVPEYFFYNPIHKGFISPKLTQGETTRTVVFTGKSSPMTNHVIQTRFTQDQITYSEKQATYQAQDLPAMKAERFVNNIDNYTASVRFELSMIRFPQSPAKTFSTDWASLTKTIYDYDDFGPELAKTGYFEKEIDQVLSTESAQNARLAAVFNYVKNHMTWNKYYGYGCNDGVKKAFKDKTGNMGEINLMLTAMLRYAGFNANPVLISTRANGIAMFPNTTAFNAVIAAVETDKGMVLLDATEKYSIPNTLPLRDLNWFGRLIRKDGTSTQIDLMESSPSREVSFLLYSIKPDGAIEGKVRNQLSEHHALDFRERYVGQNTDAYLESIEGRTNMEINDYERENELDLGKPLVEKYSFKDAKATEVINGKLYVSPLLFLADTENPFKQEKREYPVDFGYPTQSKYSVTIEIPEGYAVESMPKPLVLSTGDDVGMFKYNIGQTGNKIQVNVTTDINTAIVPADYYETIKAFYQKMVEQQAEKIVLVKA